MEAEEQEQEPGVEEVVVVVEAEEQEQGVAEEVVEQKQVLGAGAWE